MYKLITSSKDCHDLSFGFDRSRNRRKDELAQNKNVKGKYHLRIMLKDVFGFAECQEKPVMASVVIWLQQEIKMKLL